ncbi:MAG: HAMP domain-containing protein [Deferribacteres bacterium]|nr:HAMP domain-containing protein [Deferribacteres bacterium]
MRSKIWHKMIIGISVPSLIAILGVGLTYEYINDVKDREQFVQIADDLKEHVLEVRRNEKNFLRYKDEENLREIHDAVSILTRSIEGISPETAEEIGRKEFSLLKRSVQTYSALIDSLYKNFQQETEVTRRVREEGRKLERFAANWQYTGELSINLVLHLRLLEKNYMLFRDRESFVKLKDKLAELEKTGYFCNECVAYIEALRRLFATYKKSDAMVNELQATGDNLERITGRIAMRERQRISSFLTLTQRLLLVALALLCTLGPLFVYKTANHITAPIKRLAEIAKRISEGDLSLRAPLREHDETYYLAVSFNTMLDHLQLAQESLAQSLELLRQKQAQLVESEKRASIGFLVSGVAHELNNPLNNISLTAETMLTSLKDLTHEDMREYITDILSQSERAQRIVQDLLDFAGAKRSSVMEKQDIVRVVKKSINLTANQLRINNIKLIQDIPDRAFYVKGDRNKLEQVFVNIIVNAIQSMKEGEGTLTISVRPDADSRNILIKISDTGHGIPEKDLKNIFEPFFTTKSVGEGTGLGLSVSHSLIMEHNGKIEVESKPGEGSTFTVKLPLYKEPA